MQLKAKLKSLSGAVSLSLCYNESHGDRGTFLAWHLLHMTLKRKINVQVHVAKISTSFMYFSEEICSFQAITDEDVYPQSCTSEFPVLSHLHEKLQMKILTPFFELQRASCLQ